MDTIRSFRRGLNAFKHLLQIVSRSGNRQFDVLDACWWSTKNLLPAAVFLWFVVDHNSYMRRRFPEAYAGARDRRNADDGQMRVLQRQIDELRMM